MKEPDRAGETRCSSRSGVLRCRMVDARPRRSQWTDGPRGEEGARSHGGAGGSTGRGGGGVEGNSDHGDVGGWQSRRAHTALMVG